MRVQYSTASSGGDGDHEVGDTTTRDSPNSGPISMPVVAGSCASQQLAAAAHAHARERDYANAWLDQELDDGSVGLSSTRRAR